MIENPAYMEQNQPESPNGSMENSAEDKAR